MTTMWKGRKSFTESICSPMWWTVSTARRVSKTWWCRQRFSRFSIDRCLKAGKSPATGSLVKSCNLKISSRCVISSSVVCRSKSWIKCSNGVTGLWRLKVPSLCGTTSTSRPSSLRTRVHSAKACSGWLHAIGSVTRGQNRKRPMQCNRDCSPQRSIGDQALCAYKNWTYLLRWSYPPKSFDYQSYNYQFGRRLSTRESGPSAWICRSAPQSPILSEFKEWHAMLVKLKTAGQDVTKHGFEQTAYSMVFE